MKIIKQQLKFEEYLKQRLKFICEFSMEMEQSQRNKVALYLFNSINHKV